MADGLGALSGIVGGLPGGIQAGFGMAQQAQIQQRLAAIQGIQTLGSIIQMPRDLRGPFLDAASQKLGTLFGTPQGMNPTILDALKKAGPDSSQMVAGMFHFMGTQGDEATQNMFQALMDRDPDKAFQLFLAGSQAQLQRERMRTFQDMMGTSGQTSLSSGGSPQGQLPSGTPAGRSSALFPEGSPTVSLSPTVASSVSSSFQGQELGQQPGPMGGFINPVGGDRLGQLQGEREMLEKSLQVAIGLGDTQRESAINVRLSSIEREMNKLQPAPSFEQNQLVQSLANKLGRQPTPQEVTEAIDQRKIDIAKATGAGRAEAYGNIREYSVLDATQGNRPIMVPANELNRAAVQEPGRYITAGPGVAALNKTALLEDIRGGISRVRSSLEALPAFTAPQRAQLAFILRDRDPRSAMQAFLVSTVGQTLNDRQQQYIVDLAVLMENGMAMRSVLSAGQSSELLRNAILATIPGTGTPNKGYAMKQLDAFDGILNRLARGIPTVPLKEEQPIKNPYDVLRKELGQ